MVPPVTPEVTDGFVGLPASLQGAASVGGHQAVSTHSTQQKGGQRTVGPVPTSEEGRENWGQSLSAHQAGSR